MEEIILSQTAHSVGERMVLKELLTGNTDAAETRGRIHLAGNTENKSVAAATIDMRKQKLHDLLSPEVKQNKERVDF
jgi:hypothetical protein